MNFTVPLAVTAGNLPVVVTAAGQAAHSVLLPVILKPVITGVSNNASGAAGVESGSWVSIYGGGLSATTRMWNASDFTGNNLPLALDGVSVKINGKSAAVYYVSPVQLRRTSAGGQRNRTGASRGYKFLPAPATAWPPCSPMRRGSIPCKPTTPPRCIPMECMWPRRIFGASTTSRPAQPGEIVSIFGTGFGPTSPATPAGQLVSAAPLSGASPLQVTIGGVPASLQLAGIVAPGEYQLNVTIPQLADGDQPIVATVGGLSTQTGLAIPVKN